MMRWVCGLLVVLSLSANAQSPLRKFSTAPERKNTTEHTSGYQLLAQTQHCAPGHAVARAKSMGVRNATIVRLGYFGVEIVGTYRQRRIVLVFANQPGCPLIE